MPGVMFIIDTRREHIAVKEAKKLGVKTIALIDTDSDPDLIDLPIPGNDDAMRAIEIDPEGTGRRVIEGKTTRPKPRPAKASNRAAAAARSQFRAEDARPGSDAEIPAPDANAPVENAPHQEPVASA